MRVSRGAETLLDTPAASVLHGPGGGGARPHFLNSRRPQSMTDLAAAPDPSDDLWRRADRLFSEALDLPRSERSAFVDRACGSDEALRTRLHHLLGMAGQVDDPLMSPERILGAGLAELFPLDDEDEEAASDPQIGLRLGASMHWFGALAGEGAAVSTWPSGWTGCSRRA